MSLELHAQQKALEELWQQGLSGHELLLRHTGLVDTFIIDHFQASPAVQKARGAIALVALGGYGRRELYPFSDVDLLLLHDRKAKKNMQEVSESILYPLWDAGFDVGHSVRTVKDSIRFAGDDFIFQVSLLDSRMLVGTDSLYLDLLKRYRKKVLDGHRHEFVRTMEKLRGQRRSKYGSHSYLLEPHIKEGKGGMRDIQAMLWTAKAIFGLDGLAAMEESGMLEPDARKDFEASWNMLARIRNRLHYISRRHNDQLIFEYQEEMAAAFGYEDRAGMLAVEHFMRHVYGHLQTIAVVTDLFFEHVHEVLGLTEKDRGERELEKGIVARSNTLRLAVTEAELSERPHLLMRVFLQAARTGLPIHHRTRQMVTRNLQLVDDDFRNSRRIARVFIELLTQEKNSMANLETMLETGLLPAYIPEFAGVESLAQHDLYHIYTVDRHQLQTVAELDGLRAEETDLFQSLSSPHLLYLAALLHDIGKGHHTDHSVLGAEMIDDVGRRMGQSDEERNCLAFLVRYHLFLPENALRRDLDDQEFIRQTAELINDMDRLTMLYLLTIADSKATGPSAWSSWKATLLMDLYLKVKGSLEAGCTVDTDKLGEEQGVNWLREQVSDRLRPGEQVRMAVEELPADYLMSFTPEMVVRHLRMHRDQSTLLQQKVLLFPEDRHGSWSLLMLSRDRQGLLAKLCGVLALHKLSVLAAQIFTWPDGTVVDVLDVVPVANSGFDEQDWQALENDLNLAVNYRLDVGLQLHNKLQPVGHRVKRQVQQLKKKVIVDNETSRRFTVIEAYGGDRPGTLYQLTQTLSDFSLNIHRARIATEVEQLIDIFYVTTADGDKVDDGRLLEKIKQTLLQIIGDEEAE
ncbi:MAG: [protein-PII] uridylyltransferase [Thermodesulfobacteriota bacterium]|nr:[protein-PII] uridylyltransferase [Thermodesulfobacteriota bacterium]